MACPGVRLSRARTDSTRMKRNNTAARPRQGESRALSNFGVRRREKIALQEPLATLHAEPVASVGVSSAVLVVRFEQFPPADEAVILLPPLFDQLKSLTICGEA